MIQVACIDRERQENVWNDFKFSTQRCNTFAVDRSRENIKRKHQMSE